MIEFKGAQYNVTDRKVSIEEISELVGKPVWVEYVEGQWSIDASDDIEIVKEVDGRDGFQYTTVDRKHIEFGDTIEDILNGKIILYHVEEVE